MIKRIFGSLVIVLMTNFFVFSQSPKQRWVDSVYNQLDEAEKIGQLFILAVSSDADENKIARIERDLKSGILGGILFTSGHPLRQAELTNRFQGSTEVPLFIAMEPVAGLGSVLDSTIIFPSPIAQGAIESDSLIYAMSKEIARELKLLGVHLHFGPNGNFIDKRDTVWYPNLYGEDRYAVTRKISAYQKGISENGIMIFARDFKIQGVTVVDFRGGIPSPRIFGDSIQNFVFRKMMTNGVDGIMPGVSKLPVFYESKKTSRKNKFNSAMLSSYFTGSWLKSQVGYNGLIVMDVRPFENKSAKVKVNDSEFLAFQTGNELIVTDDNPSSTIRKIRKIIKKDKSYDEVLSKAVKKILAAKYEAGLTTKPFLSTDNLMAKLNNADAKVLQQELFRATVTVVKDVDNAIPVRVLENNRIASLIVGDATPEVEAFHDVLRKYVLAKKYTITTFDTASLHAIGRVNETIIVLLTRNSPVEIIDELANTFSDDQHPVIIADLGYPFKRNLSKFRNVITGFDEGVIVSRIIPQAVFGGIGSSGVTPLAIGKVKTGSQIITPALKRLSYSIPEDAGISSNVLNKIEGIANEAIAIRGTPGCHVFVAKGGKVVYEKSFGHYTYDKSTPVTDSTIYDLASVTKVSATLQAVMFMHDRGLFDMNKKASYYLPELKKSNKKDFTIKDILTHQAGLWPFIPFYVYTMKDSSYVPGFYVDKPTLQYPNMVAAKMYTYSAMPDTLWNWAIKGKIREKPARTPFDYKYSDIGFYIMQRLSERLLNQPLQDFVEQNLYEPLGAYTTGYQPLLKFPTSRIAPTENDKLFRKTLLTGTVHDPGAAMHGGVAGHAGLFSTANDLAKLGQMLLQEGYYGGYQYYKPETVRLFSQRQYASNHRGLGWAKPILGDATTPTSVFASQRTFGHTGYTGTCIWIDPEFDLVYIFLSNRVHPDVSTKLLSANIRSRIQDVIYESIFDYCSTHPKVEQNEKIFTTAAGK